MENFFSDSSIVDQNGRGINLNQIKEKPLLCYFFFTSCKTICPLMTKHIRDFEKKISSNTSIHVIGISVDPETDSVGMLNAYYKELELNSDNWKIVTGKKSKIYHLASDFFNLKAAHLEDGSEFLHSNKFILLDRNMNIRSYYEGTDSNAITKIILDITKLNRNEKSI